MNSTERKPREGGGRGVDTHPRRWRRGVYRVIGITRETTLISHRFKKKKTITNDLLSRR